MAADGTGPDLDPTARGVHSTEVRDAYDYVIVGAGMAAAKAVRGIRSQDPDGGIGVFGTQPAPPVYRPDLSKTLWVDPKASVLRSPMAFGDPGSDTPPDLHTRPHPGTTRAARAPPAHARARARPAPAYMVSSCSTGCVGGCPTRPPPARGWVSGGDNPLAPPRGKRAATRR